MNQNRQVILAYAYVSAIAILGCAFFYWNVYQNRASHLESRNLGIVSGIGSQILLKLEQVSRPIWENANAAWNDNQEPREHLNRLPSIRQTETLPGKALTVKTPTIILDIDPPSFRAVLMAPAKAPIQVDIHQEALFDWKLDKDFESLILFRRNPNGKGYQRLDGETRSSRQLLDVNQLKSSKDHPWTPEQALSQSSVGQVQLAGKQYRIYSYPIQIPLDADFEEDTLGRRTYRPKRTETWVVAGLVAADLLHEQQMQVSPHFAMAMVMAILLLIFSLPLLRLRYLCPWDKIGKFDVIQLKLGLLFSSFILCMGFAYVFVFAVVHFQIDDHVMHFSDAVHRELQTEVEQTLDFLDAYATNPSVVAPPQVRQVFRTNDKGQQMQKEAYREGATAAVNIGHRDYFQMLQEGKGYPYQGERFAIQPLVTITEGAFAVLIARPIIGGNGQFQGILAAVTELESVMNPITPPLSRFIITNHDGLVLFNQDSHKNLSENFFQETNDPDNLYLLTRAQVRRLHHVTYQGRDFRCFTSPALNQVPWVIHTLSYKQPIREFYLAMTTQITLWFLFYALIIIGMSLLFRLFIYVTNFDMGLLVSPSQIPDRVWGNIAIISILAIVAQKILLFTPSLAHKGWIILIGLGLHIVAVSFIYFGVKKGIPPQDLKTIEETDWLSKNRHILVFCIFSIATLILPMLAFTKGAYRATASLYIKQGQLDMLDDLRERSASDAVNPELPPYLNAFFDTKPVANLPEDTLHEQGIHFALRDRTYLLEDQAKRRGFHWAMDFNYVYLKTGQRTIASQIPSFFPYKNGEPVILGTLVWSLAFFGIYLTVFFIAARFVFLTLSGEGIRQPRIYDHAGMLHLFTLKRSQRHLVLGSDSPFFQELLNQPFDPNTAQQPSWLSPQGHPDILVVNIKIFLLNHPTWTEQKLVTDFEALLAKNPYRCLIIDMFDYVPANIAPSDPTFEALKFHCVERMLARSGTSLFLFSSSHPACYYQDSACLQTGNGEADDTDIQQQIDWQRLLKSFRTIGYASGVELSFKSEAPLTQAQTFLIEETRHFARLIDVADEIDTTDLSMDKAREELYEASRGQYHDIWSHCCKAERLMLHDLAEDGLFNPTNTYILRVLCARNLIVYHGRFRLFSSCFADYVLHEFDPSDMPTDMGTSRMLYWNTMRIPITLLVVGGLGFVYFTQPTLWTTLGSFVSTISIAILPTATKLIQSFIVSTGSGKGT